MEEEALVNSPTAKLILEKYPNKEKFLLEAIKILDRLLNFHIEIKGCHGQSMIRNQWESLISSCHKSIDFLIESSFESSYCRFENKD